VVAQGLGPFTYQWYQIPSVGSTSTLIPGATAAVYTTPAVDLSYDGAKYYAAVIDSCTGVPLVSANATMTVTAASVPPTILTQPAGLDADVDAGGAFTVVATGSGTLSYQWYWIPVSFQSGFPAPGPAANSATYNVPVGQTDISNDQDQYYVLVSNDYGQTTSTKAALAVGAGILVTQQPQTAYVTEGDIATFTVAVSSVLPLTYQWYSAPAGSSNFAPIVGATNATLTLNSAALADNGNVYEATISNGTSVDVASTTAALFVGPLAQVPDLCDQNWNAVGDAVVLPNCQLTSATFSQHGEIVWPTLIATDNIVLSFTVTLDNPSYIPADGFAVVLGDPSLGATPTSIGDSGQGLGAEGIPGLVFGFDTCLNTDDPPVPYVAVGRGEYGLFENPWYLVNTNIPALIDFGGPISHDYTVTLVRGVPQASSTSASSMV
jgi:Bacterial lectin